MKWYKRAQARVLSSVLVGLISLLIIGSVVATYSANFTGLTGTVVGFLTVGGGIALLVKMFRG